MFVGGRHLRVTDQTLGIEFPVFVMYPTESPSTPTAFGPYSIDLSLNAPIADGSHPLVVVSHGNGGSHLLYRAVCAGLARSGYVVAMLEHHGNHRNDNRLNCSYENLVYRPRHVRMTIDAVASLPELQPFVQAENVAVIGHSIGGYTALAVAGGRPWSEDRREVEVVADPRVRALVLFAPATLWYLAEGSLLDVKAPILMFVAEHDPYTPRMHADLVLNGVADRAQVDCRVVANAGHFSFLSPFPAHLRRPDFLPATDPEGFDRERFHERLPIEVQEFLDRVMKPMHPSS